MSLIVEDGTGLSTAESYISGADTLAYASSRGLTFTNDAAGEQALRRATTWIDATYGQRFGGYRVSVNQALVFPRSGLVDREGYGIAYNAVPRQIAQATAEAAVRELASPGSLNPDVTPGTVKKRVRVEGAVEVEYAVGAGGVASQTPVISIIDGILAPLIGAASSPYVGRAVRA
jgi:hypothetical protein